MLKNKKYSVKKHFWTWVALISLALASPNVMIIRMFVSESVDPFFWVLLRSFTVAIVCLPLLIIWRNKLANPKILRGVLLSGIMMTVAIIAHTKAIELSSASYVAVITLAYPIFLVTISAWMFKERITRRALAGIGLGALGGVALVLLPLAASAGSIEFNLPATILGIVNLLGFTLATANMRRLSEQKVPLVLQIGVSSVIMMLVAGFLVVIFGIQPPKEVGLDFWLAAIYSGIGVMLLIRWASTAAYSHVGGVVMGAFNYVEVFLAILLPVFILGEKLSISMVIGGTLIVAGVYLLEHHKNLAHLNHRHHG